MFALVHSVVILQLTKGIQCAILICPQLGWLTCDAAGPGRCRGRVLPQVAVRDQRATAGPLEPSRIDVTC